MSRPVLHLRVPPGIGDFAWMWTKLCHLAKDHELRITTAAEGQQDIANRAHPFFDLLRPRVTFAGTEQSWTTAQCCEQTFSPTRSSAELVEAASARPTFLSVNHLLEAGGRIEGFLPDLPMEWRPEWPGRPEDVAAAESMLAGKACPIAIYVSAYGSARAWGFWDAAGWLELVDRVEISLGFRPTWVVIGAKFDADLTMDVIRGLRYRNADVVNQLGLHIGVAIELLRRSRYVFGFPSGIPILSGLMGVPTLMFFPPHLDAMRTTFIPSNDLEEDLVLHVPFCSPENAQLVWTLRGMRHAIGEA